MTKFLCRYFNLILVSTLTFQFEETEVPEVSHIESSIESTLEPTSQQVGHTLLDNDAPLEIDPPVLSPEETIDDSQQLQRPESAGSSSSHCTSGSISSSKEKITSSASSLNHNEVDDSTNDVELSNVDVPDLDSGTLNPDLAQDTMEALDADNA